MNSKELYLGFNEIDDSILERSEKAVAGRRKPAWLKWCAMAACFAIAVFTAFTALTSIDQPDITPPDGSNGIIGEDSQGNKPPVTAAVEITLNSIYVNELAGRPSETDLGFDPEMYDTITWDEKQISQYYGRSLTVPYIPTDLSASPWNGTATVVVGKDGNIARDTAGLGFYHDYYDDGSPKLTEEIAALKGFSVTASKLGILNDCIYLLPDDELKTSDIQGTVVTFGHRKMAYGPFEPNTNEPSGYYDLYVAEFMHEDIHYQVITEQMDPMEVVKIVTSIITGNSEITVSGSLHDVGEPAHESDGTNTEKTFDNPDVPIAEQDYSVGEPVYEEQSPAIEGSYDNPENPVAEQNYSVGEPEWED